MDLLQHMETFVRIADAGSISSAARGLRLSVAMTSRHLRALEEELGVELVRRTTRKLALTPAGDEFLLRARSVIAAANEACDVVRPGKGAAGRLVVSLPVSFGLAQVGPIFPALLEAHPRLELDLRFEDRYADLLGDGVDLAIRTGTHPPDSTSVIARNLAYIDRVLCASPALLARHPVSSVGALARVPCVVQGNNTRWVFRSVAGPGAPRAGATSEVVVRPRMRTNSITALLEAVAGSTGVGRLPLWLAHEYLQKKKLVRVLPEVEPVPVTIFGMFHHGSRGSAAIHATLEFLARELPRRTKMRAVERPGRALDGA